MEREKVTEWGEVSIKRHFMDRAPKQNEGKGNRRKGPRAVNVVGEPLAAAEVLLCSATAFALQ